jgi:hypothetical protein
MSTPLPTREVEDNSDHNDDEDTRVKAALDEFLCTLGATPDVYEATAWGVLCQAAREFVRVRTGFPGKLHCKSIVVGILRNGVRTTKRVCPCKGGYAVLP